MTLPGLNHLCEGLSIAVAGMLTVYDRAQACADHHVQQAACLQVLVVMECLLTAVLIG